MSYSYIIQPNYCEGTLRNFDPIKSYFLFSPLYAKTKSPILVPIDYLQFVEGGATKCMHRHSFTSRGTGWRKNFTTDSHQNKKHKSSTIFLRCSRTANSTSTLVPLLLVWHVMQSSWNFSEIQTIELRISSLNIERRPQSYNHNLGSQFHQLKDSLISQTHFLYNFPYNCFLFLVIIYVVVILSCFTPLKIRLSLFHLPPSRDLLKKALILTYKFNRKVAHRVAK